MENNRYYKNDQETFVRKNAFTAQRIHFYSVYTKCGHVGRNHYMPIHFPVRAQSAKDAAMIAREMPKVKHDHKDAILKVTEIDYRDYCDLKANNSNDPYLNCHNRQEQARLVLAELEERLALELRETEGKNRESTRRDVYAGKVKVRHPRRYFNRYLPVEEEEY